MDLQRLLLLLTVALAGTAKHGECGKYRLIPNNQHLGGAAMLSFAFEIDDSRLNSGNLSFELSPEDGYWRETMEANRLSLGGSQRNTTGSESSTRPTFNLHMTGDHFYVYTMSYGDFYIVFFIEHATDSNRDPRPSDFHGPYLVPRKLQILYKRDLSTEQPSFSPVQLLNERLVTITRGPKIKPPLTDADRFFIFTFPEPLPEDASLPTHFDKLYSGNRKIEGHPQTKFLVIATLCSKEELPLLKDDELANIYLKKGDDGLSNGTHPTVRYGVLAVTNIKKCKFPDFLMLPAEGPAPILMCWNSEIGSEPTDLQCERYVSVAAHGTTGSKYYLRDAMLKSKPHRNFVRVATERILSWEKRHRMALKLGLVPLDLRKHEQHGNEVPLDLSTRGTRSEMTSSSDGLHSSNGSNRQQQSTQVPISNSTGSKRIHPYSRTTLPRLESRLSRKTEENSSAPSDSSRVELSE